MMRTFKAIFLMIGVIIIIGLILPGCYTQLSRPRVVTEDEYYEPTENDTVEAYYQDEGTPGTEDSRDVYINNYYPPYGIDYYDSWYWNSYPNRWGYIGPYPDYWWNTYGPWWTPGWYVGISHYDYWWGGHYRYYDSYYWSGYHGRDNHYIARNFERRSFDRRSIRAIGRDERASDSQTSLAKPQGPTRVERPQQPLSTPETQDRLKRPEQPDRPVKEMVNQRLRTKPAKALDTRKSSEANKERSTSRQTRTIKTPPRSTETSAKPKIIERTPSRATPDTPRKNSTTPERSSNKNSNSISRPSSSGNTNINRPSAPSYTPRNSNSGSSTRSTPPPRSSSSPSRSSNSSGNSKSSGSSKTTKK